MDIRALFFASYRDLLGHATLSVQVPEGTTVDELVTALRGRGAPFDRLPTDPAVAVNRDYAAAEHVLRSGDEVAFIPPVAGG